MKFKIKDEEIELKYSFRINVYFEQIASKSINFKNLTANDVITLFYCTVISTLQKMGKPIITMLEFLDYVDENNGEACVMQFSEWYVGIMTAQYELIESMQDEKKPEPKKKSKKKTS